MKYEQSFFKTNEMKKALGDMVELIDDVSAGFHIPKKFRKAPFTPALRDKYVAYLCEEAKHLSDRIHSLERPRIKPVKVKSEVTS